VFRYKGASWHIQDKHIPWTEFRARWLYINHMAGESASILPKLLEQAKSKGIQIAWNPGTTQLEKPQELQKLMAYADLFIVNQEEASQLVGIPYQKKKQIFRKLDALVQGKVIMTKGKKGVEVSDGKVLWSAGVLPLAKSEVIDRTGAGDAFGSGFVAALMQKPSDIEYAIQFASANATGVLTKWGANHGLIRRGESPHKFGKLEIKKTSL
jgi:sugar/nucleoside kinase (ribokinase family)